MSDTIITISPVEFARLPLFKSVSIFEVEDVLLKSTLLRLDAGKIVIAAGQSNQRMYVVLRGELSVHLESLQNDPVATIGTGEVFGELSVIDSEPTSAYVVAQTKCRLLGIDQEGLWEMFRRTPHVANNLLAQLTRRVRSTNEHIRRLRGQCGSP